MSSTFLLLIVISLAGLQQTFCQDDVMDSRAQKIMSEGGTGGGQSRQLHSQKHFSPHRMMHFGKRPLTQLPPALPAAEQQTSIPLESGHNMQMLANAQQKRLALVDEQQERLVQQGLFPYSVVYDTPREQLLEASQPGLDMRRDKHLMDIVEHLLQFSKQQKACNTNTNNNKRQQQDDNNQQEIPERMMKLINGETDSSYELAANLEKLQQQQQLGEQTNEQQEQTTGNSEQQDAINVVGRSVQRPRAGEPFDLTKAHISSLLFGRRITEPPSSLMSLGGFIKKNEPQRMTFMHFG